MPLLPLLEARIAAWQKTREEVNASRLRLPEGEEVATVLTLDDPRSCSLAHFSIKGRLGAGSFSSIQKVAEKSTGRIFALKEVDKHFLVKEKKAPQAKAEMEALIALRECKLVLRLFCTFQTPQCLYYLLEYCANRDLQYFVARYGCFAPHTRQFYTAQIVAALGFLQAQGIVHRDLKPENIMLNHHMHVRLGDFACARLLNGPSGRRKNSFVGTAEYVAPEVLDGGAATTATDLWSLGAILFYLATGTHPFDGESEYLVFQNVCAAKYTLPPALPASDKDLIARLLVADPKSRLGAEEAGGGGVAALQAHAFFAGVDWASITDAPAPSIEAYLPDMCQDYASMHAAVQALDEAGAEDLPRDPHAPWDLASAPWSVYLKDGETALREGLRVQSIVGYTRQTKVLVITDRKRLLLMDYPTMANPKELDIGEDCWCECWSSHLVLFHMEKKTYYVLSEVEDAFLWECLFNKVKAM